MALRDSWESLYPLTESQKDFFVALNEVCRPRGGPQQQTPQLQQLAVSSPNGSSHAPSPRSPDRSSPLETQTKPTRGPLETTQQFLTWFAEIERDMARGDEDDYREYSALVESYCHSTTEVLKNLDQTTDQVESLRRNNAFVYEKTRGLQSACEKLLDEQVSYLVSGTVSLQPLICSIETHHGLGGRLGIQTSVLQFPRNDHKVS